MEGIAETPADLLKQLRRLHDEGRVSLALDFGRLAHMDSPVGVEADSNIWAYGVVAVTLAALWFAGWKIALAAAFLGAAAYFTLGKHYVRRRILRRVRTQALADSTLWQKLWRFGGVTLAAGAAQASAPRDDWMALVRSLTPPAP
jgi:hypothetical protein